MSGMTACPRCGASNPSTGRFCGSCAASLAPDDGVAAVGSAVAHEGRLSDSGALELKRILESETKGDYEIREEVGRGGMAVVYRAEEIHLARTVAIKILPPELTFARGATERFRREAKTAAALDHANIIPIYRISSSGRLFWYAMKFLDGRSLADILLEKGLLTLGETVAILEQVAEALDYAHQRSVVHRDIKPGNVMLDARGRVIVTDFGIAKELSGSGLTGSGAILGTPYYMSPEQCRGGELTGAADQYSLAVMAYQMISGHLPFEADSAIDVIHKHVAEPPPPLEALLPGLPRHVINAINRGMSKKPSERFPTITAFVNALQNEPSGATLIMSSRRTSAAALPRGTVRRAALRLAATATVLVAVVAVTVVGTLKLVRGGPAGPSAQAPSVVPAPASAPAAGNPGPAAAEPAAGIAAGQRSGAAAAPSGQGYLRVRVVGGWANITVAGRTITEARVWADSVPAGSHTVVFTRPRYATLRRTVLVRPGQATGLIEVTLAPETAQP